jgi:hypothetical protein
VSYVHSATLTLGYGVTDSGSGVATVTPAMDGGPTVAGGSLPSGRVIDLLTSLPLGQHTFTIDAVDSVGNASARASVTFTIIVTAESVIGAVNQLVASGGIGTTTRASLMAKLGNAMELRRAGQCEPAAQVYAAFINQVRAQTGKSIEPTAAAILIGDAQYLIANCP